MNDALNPNHYKSHPSGIECIQITEHMDFLTGNAMKYLWRAGMKDDKKQDLEKAKWYIERLLDKESDLFIRISCTGCKHTNKSRSESPCSTCHDSNGDCGFNWEPKDD